MKNSLLYKIVAQTICFSAISLAMYPLLLMLVRSVDGKGWHNYVLVFSIVNIFPNFKTSIIVVFCTLALVSVVTSLAAFAFSKLQFPLKWQTYYLLLTGMMIPTSAILFPLFQIVKGLNLNNTPWALVFPYATLNALFNLLILKNYFDTLPNELMEAARIDGANTWQVYLRIMLPISVPGMAIVLVSTFLASWNELQMAITFVNNTALQPISVVPLRFLQTAGSSSFPLGVMYASLVICLLPIAIFYVFAQKLLINGLTQGAVKG